MALAVVVQGGDVTTPSLMVPPATGDALKHAITEARNAAAQGGGAAGAHAPRSGYLWAQAGAASPPSMAQLFHGPSRSPPAAASPRHLTCSRLPRAVRRWRWTTRRRARCACRSSSRRRWRCASRSSPGRDQSVDAIFGRLPSFCQARPVLLAGAARVRPHLPRGVRARVAAQAAHVPHLPRQAALGGGARDG